MVLGITPNTKFVYSLTAIILLDGCFYKRNKFILYYD